MIILACFGAWALCALGCLTFFALLSRGGQLEDRMALELAQQHALERTNAAASSKPALSRDAGVVPRAALDDELVPVDASRV